MSPLILSAIIFCIWPMIVGFIGWQIGRRGLRLRSPFYAGRLADPEGVETADQPEEPIRESTLRRLRRDVGYKS